MRRSLLPNLRVGWRRLVGLAAACLLLLTGRPASAEIEGAGLVSYRWFNPKSELGRYLDDPTGTSIANMAGFGMRIGWLPWQRLGFEGELIATPTSTKDERASVVVFSTRGQAVFNLLTGRVRPFVALGAGFSFSSTANPVWLETDNDAEGHVGAGLRVDLGSDWGVRADGRAIVGPGQDKAPVLGVECALSIYGRFPWKSPPPQSPDQDGDGITDAQDKCPDVAGAVTLEGCPGEEKSDDDVDADEADAAKKDKDDAVKPAAPEAPAEPKTEKTP